MSALKERRARLQQDGPLLRLQTSIQIPIGWVGLSINQILVIRGVLNESRYPERTQRLVGQTGRKEILGVAGKVRSRISLNSYLHRRMVAALRSRGALATFAERGD